MALVRACTPRGGLDGLIDASFLCAGRRLLNATMNQASPRSMLILFGNAFVGATLAEGDWFDVRFDGKVDIHVH
jgi:hypothetical protein